MFLKSAILTLISPILWAVHFGISYSVTHLYYSVPDVMSTALFQLSIAIVTLVCGIPVVTLIIAPHRALSYVMKEQSGPPAFFFDVIRYLSVISLIGIIWGALAIFMFTG